MADSNFRADHSGCSAAFESGMYITGHLSLLPLCTEAFFLTDGSS